MDEKIGCRIHCFDGKSLRLGELHERHSLRSRAAKPDEVDVLRHASRLEPERDEGSADEQPVSVEASDRGSDQGLDAALVELACAHGARLERMEEAWNVLCACGLPDGAIRPASSSPNDAVLRALAEVATHLGALSRRDREVLFAWLCAFRQHWPTAFRTVLGATGEHVLGALESESTLFDSNRYLKLRRIAIENLATAFA